MDLVERFINYAKFETTADTESGTRPSNPLELKLLECIKIELEEMGLEATMKDGFVYSFIKSDRNAKDSIFLMAHVDTSPDASNKNTKPRIVHYEGGTIKLSDTKELNPLEFESLNNHVGHDLIVTNGETLLGADDKAGVAIIMDYVETALKNGNYPNIILCFSADEEIGEGTRDIDIELIKKNQNNIYAYTVDGGDIHEFNYETFNALGARVKINGLSVHTGSAYRKMINATEVFYQFHNMLSKARPENTNDRMGFIHCTRLESQTESANASYILRSFNPVELRGFEKQFIDAQNKINEFYNKNIVEVEIHEQYRNMKEKIDEFPDVVNFAHNALKENGIEYVDEPIRGGTDGSALSFMGLPCPNLGTGGDNFHGVYEYVDIDQMKTMVKVIASIANQIK